MRDRECFETWLFLGERHRFPLACGRWLWAMVVHSPIFHVPVSLEVELMALSLLTVTSWILLLHFHVKNFCSLRLIPLPTANHYSSTTCHSPASFIVANGSHFFLKSCHQPGCLQNDLPDTWLSGFLTLCSFFLLHAYAYVHLFVSSFKKIFWAPTVWCAKSCARLGDTVVKVNNKQTNKQTTRQGPVILELTV